MNHTPKLKLKVFTLFTDYEDIIENIINQWIKTKSSIEIVDIKYILKQTQEKINENVTRGLFWSNKNIQVEKKSIIIINILYKE
jgi:hypothetical protein